MCSSLIARQGVPCRLPSTLETKERLCLFEPSASSDPKLLDEALDLAHIVKVSSDRLAGNEGVLTCYEAEDRH